MNSSNRPFTRLRAASTVFSLSARTVVAILASLLLWTGADAAQSSGPILAKGAIKQVGAGSITFNDKPDAATVALDGATVVKVNGQAAKVSDLKAGMSAIAFGEQGKPATEIRAYAPRSPSTTPPPSQPSVYGNIGEIEGGKITIEKKGQPSVTAAFDGTTVVKVNGKVATAAELKAGMIIIALGAADKPATEVRAYDQKGTTPLPSQPGISGTITQVGDGKITIQSKNQTSSTATYDSATIVKVNGKVATAADLKVGMLAGALGAEDKPATEIRAYLPR